MTERWAFFKLNATFAFKCLLWVVRILLTMELTELDGAPLINSTAPSTIMTYLFPIVPIELGAGFVVGSDKVITKVSGTFRSSSASAAAVYVYANCLQVAKVHSGGATTPGVQIRHGEVTIDLSQPTQAAVVLWQ